MNASEDDLRTFFCTRRAGRYGEPARLRRPVWSAGPAACGSGRCARADDDVVVCL